MTDKKYDYKEFNVYGSKDGKKACAFKLLEHFRLKEDSQVETSMWWKIQVETTNDWWKKDWDKKIIMLEGEELVNLIWVLIWKLKKSKWMRNNPVKIFEFEDQGDNYFLQLKSNNTSHWFRLNKYDWLRLMAFAWKALEKEFDNLYWIYMIWVDYVKELFNNKQVVIQENDIAGVNNEINEQDKEIEVENVWNSVNCKDCWIEMDKTKFEKVIKYSTDKYGKCLCMSCQKKQ